MNPWMYSNPKVVTVKKVSMSPLGRLVVILCMSLAEDEGRRGREVAFVYLPEIIFVPL